MADKYTITQKGSLGKMSMIGGIVLLLVSFAGYFMDSAQFFQSYLLGYMFWLTLALGGLFFTIISNLFGADWNVVLRRISEATMYTFPLLAIFFIPILLGMHDLYHWTHEEVALNDEIIRAKTGYLNIPFFTIRAIFYFSCWFVISRMLYKLSLKQDKEPSDALILKMNKISAPSIIVFALTTSFASFDWLMSLEPHWFSTIYGLYFFGGCFLTILCFVILMALYLRKTGHLKDVITIEHYHDLGKLLFAFLIFWGYMGFSQYFIIWYANIPEETIWYIMRWENGWHIITLILVIVHFTIPFLLLTFRGVKRNFTSLKLIAWWVIILRLVDIYWLTAPTFAHGHGPTISWMDISLLLGIGGLFIWNVWNNLTANPLVPIGDRRLAISIKHKV